MNHEKLKKSHKKLTLLFTIVVWSVVFVLGFSLLVAKYYNELRLQKRDFITESNEIQVLISSQNIPLKNIFFNQILEKRSMQERFSKGKKRFQSSLSFLIINANNEIIFENILENVDFGKIQVPSSEALFHTDNILYRMLPLDSSYGEKIFFYSATRYTSDVFLRDLFLLLLTLGVFSYFVYFLGDRFVGRALKPVEENLDDMQAFIHNAGHELKTPLAVLRGNLQVMQAEKSFDAELLKTSISQIDTMNTLIESLRELSELGNLREKSSLQLVSIVENILEGFNTLIQSRKITVEKNIPDTFYIKAHPYELQVFLSNIIKNAIIYNTLGGKISLSLSKNIFEVRDTGVGISKTEREKIFERFYRADTTRNSEEGFGIGLSLVKKIAENNGWNIEIESELGKGTLFRVIF